MLFDPKWEEKIVVKEEPWRQVLRDAADLIENNGWVRGSLVSNTGFGNDRYCAIGAISKAATGSVYNENDPMSHEAAMHLLSEINRWRWYKINAVWIWNDFGHQKKSEVIRTMRKAAER